METNDWEVKYYNRRTALTRRTAGRDKREARQYANRIWASLVQQAGGWVELWCGDKLIQRADISPQGGPF